MKKKIRFLPLFLSVLLLCATAFPASALGEHYYGPEHYWNGFPIRTGTTTGSAASGQYTANAVVMAQTYNFIWDRRATVSGVNGTHDGGGETWISVSIGDGEVGFQGDQDYYSGDYHNVMAAAGEQAGVAYQVYSDAAYFDCVIPATMTKTEYQLYAYCNFGAISVTVRDNSGNRFTQTINRTPYLDGIFYYLDY